MQSQQRDPTTYELAPSPQFGTRAESGIGPSHLRTRNSRLQIDRNRSPALNKKRRIERLYLS
jgi:hypothetical protein